VTVYVIAQLTFTDIAAYRRYQKAFPEVFANSGGKVLVADEAPQVLEGSWSGNKVVVLAFPDEAAARRFQEDPLYLEISKDRMAGADAVVLQVKGL